MGTTISIITESLFAVQGVCEVCRQAKLVEFTAETQRGIYLSLCRSCRDRMILDNKGSLHGSTWIASES